MNNNNHNSNNNSNNSQQWMMPSEHGPEPFNYMVSRPPGSVLPMPPHVQQQQQHPHQQQPQHHPNQSMQHKQEEELSVSPPAQALDYDHPRFHNKGGNRAVIPSKRAAQNRAAQKAFRQRREQYIKDLEIKAKEMEDWQDEMDKLRKENGELRERVATLENQVNVLTGGDPSKIPVTERNKSTISTPTVTKEAPLVESPVVVNKSPERSMSLPITSRIISENEEIVRRGSTSPVSITSSVKRSHNESRLRHEHHEPSEDNLQQEGSFAPVPLRAPNQTGFESTLYHPNDHTATLIANDTTIDNNKRRKLEDPHLMGQPQHIGQVPTIATPPSNPNFSSNPIIQQHANPPPPQQQPTNTSSNTHNPLLLPIQQQQQPQQHQQQQPQQHPTNDFWSGNNANMQVGGGNAGGNAVGDFELDFDFDPFFEDEFGPTITNSNDFLPNANSGQVLDDLFAMLQTRQRPQIPIIPTDDNLDFNNSGNNSNNNNNLM